MALENQGLGEQSVTRPEKGMKQQTKGNGVLAQRRRFAIAELPELPEDDKELDDKGESLKEEGLTFSQLLEESQKGAKFAEGEVVEGQVVGANRDYVTVDIGYKSEGQINASEFLDQGGELMIAAGDH